MWKYIISIILLSASLVYAGFYLYNYDKKGGSKTNLAFDKLSKTQAISASQPDMAAIQPKEQDQPHLRKGFWKEATPEKLESYLKTIANVNEVRSDNKKSMLHLLAEHGNYPEMVQMLIDAGVDYNLKDEVIDYQDKIDNRKALFYAIYREDQAYEFSKPLLDSNVNSYINNNIPPLVLAAYERKAKIVQALLKKGADPNLKSLIYQSTALHAASITNEFTNDSYIDPHTIQLLIDHKADIKAKNKDGKTAFDYMKENEEFTKTELFQKLSEQFSSLKKL